jgi:DNA-binding beta-propeller fold protein YncE
MTRWRRILAGIAVLVVGACSSGGTPKSHATTQRASTPGGPPTSVAMPTRYRDRGTNIALGDGALDHFDVSWVDGPTSLYLLADRDHRSLGVIDTRTDAAKPAIPGFAGPSGVVTGLRHEAWVSDTDSTLKVVDLAAGAVVGSVSTGGRGRADELAYDAKDDLILVGNGEESPPFLTLVSARARAVVAKLAAPAGTVGIQAVVWDPTSALFYIAVLGTTAAPGGVVEVIDPRTRKMTSSIVLGECLPVGLALGPRDHLFVGCIKKAAKIVDLSNGSTIGTIPEAAGADEVTYNPKTSEFIAARSAGNIVIVDATTNKVVQVLPTATGAHSVATDPNNRRIYVPEPGKGVEVFVPEPDHQPG